MTAAGLSLEEEQAHLVKAEQHIAEGQMRITEQEMRIERRRLKVHDTTRAAELLAKTPKPSREQIVEHMDGNICRCGTYHNIIAAIQLASKEG